jgi:ribosomal protein S27E
VDLMPNRSAALKAGHLRAVRTELQRLRCPNCNRASSLTATSTNASCSACGALFSWDADFRRRDTRSGFKWVADTVRLEAVV